MAESFLQLSREPNRAVRAPSFFLELLDGEANCDYASNIQSTWLVEKIEIAEPHVCDPDVLYNGSTVMAVPA